MTAAQIAQSFSVQTEATNSYAYLANPNVASVSTFLTSVYANLFNRAPDAAGLAYWTGEINSGRSNVGNAIINIISGAQDNATTGNLDLTTITNKMTAGLTWAQAMANVNGAVYNTATAASAASIVAAATSVASTVTTAATNTTNFFANGGGITPTIVALDTSVNAVTGVSNITVNATDTSAPAQTWTALDSINLTGTGNTFNVASATAISAPAGATVSGVQTMNVTESGATQAITLSTTGYSGLTQLNATNSGTGTDTLTAAATTSVNNTGSSTGAVLVYGGNNVTITSAGGAITVGSAADATKANAAGNIVVTDTSAATAAVTVDGGVNQTVTITGANAANATTAQATSGTFTQATGTVTISETTATGGATDGKITVKGGTIITITEAAGDTVKAAGTANSTDVMGTVVVTGTTATTTVSVTQAAAAAVTTAVTGVAPVSAVTAVSAAPGVTAKAAVTAVTGVDAITGLVGVTAGTVDIADKTAANSTTATTAGTAGGTITTVALNNYGAANISSPVLSNLTLTGVGGTLGLYKGGLASATNTALTLNVNNLSGTNTITDNSAQYTTLNIVTGATKSSLTGFTDASLKTLNVSGSSVLTVTNATSATTINVSGTAGYTGSINATTTTFTDSGSGTSVITIAADATKKITSGTGTGDEIIANFTGATAANTGANVIGFNILGITTNTGTQDASVYGSSIRTIDVTASGITSVLSKVNQGASITLAAAATTTTALTVGYADVQGATDSTTITFAGPTASKANFAQAAQAITSLTLADANSIGIGTINIVDNNVVVNFANDAIATLVDSNVSNLNVSGIGGITIGAAAFTNAATSMTINNTDTNAAGLVLSMTDNSLGTLNVTGTGKTTLTLTDTVAGTLAITNSGTGSLTVSDGAGTAAANLLLTGAMTATFTDANVRSLSLAANQTVTFTDSGTTGTVISGASDNNAVTLYLSGTGAASTVVDTITLGNGNNSIIDTERASTVNVTVGTGQNLIQVGALVGNNNSQTGAFNINLGTPTTGFNLIEVNNAGGNFATAANYVVTGATTGTEILFENDPLSVSGTLTATSLTGAANVAGAISTLETAASAAHSVAWGVYGGSTYVVDTLAAGGASATNSTVVQLSGLSATAITASNGFITVGSTASTSSINPFGTISGALTATGTYTSNYNNVYSITTAAVADTNTVTLTGATSSGTINLSASSGTGVQTVTTTASGGTFTILTAAGADVISAGTGLSTITAGAGLNTITLAAHGANSDVIVVNAPAAAANLDTVAGFVAATDDVKFSIAGLGTTPLVSSAGAGAAPTVLAANATVKVTTWNGAGALDLSGVAGNVGTTMVDYTGANLTLAQLTTLVQAALTKITVAANAATAGQALLIEYGNSGDASIHVAAITLGAGADTTAATAVRDLVVLTGVATHLTAATNVLSFVA